MGNPYTSVTVTNYNATPPPDDGSNVSANEITWAKHKTKLGDPLKTAVEAIDTNLLAAFQKIMFAGVTSTGSPYTVQASDQGKMIRVTAGVTITTPSGATVGTPFAFIVRNDHTADITIDGNGSETINGSATFALPADNSVMLGTDGTNWFTGSATGVTRENLQNQSHVYAADTGAADAYVITLSPVPSAYAEGQRFSFKAVNANTTTSTLNVNSLGVKTIKKNAGTDDLIAGDIAAGQIVDVEYDGTNFQMSSVKGIDVQPFTGSGTWTKPSNYTATSKVLVQLWGGGGSGGFDATPGGAGGGGGGYSEALFDLSDLGATETVTIGDGGAAVTGAADGNPGVNSTFGSLLTAYAGGAGGGNGVTPGGGGGGGLFSLGGDGAGTAAGAGGTPIAGTAGSSSAGGDSTFGGGGGAHDVNDNGGLSVWGGGGGGAGGAGSDGGKSFYGGGGGGGSKSSGPGSGGVSVRGGDGGAGGTTSGTAGTQPGGGGGGAISSTSGAGAAGQCIVTIFPA